MTLEDFKAMCQDELIQLNSSEYSKVDNSATLMSLSSKIETVAGITNLVVSEGRGDEAYKFGVRFMNSCGEQCSFVIEHNDEADIEDEIYKCISDGISSREAIAFMNSELASKRADVTVRFVFGYSKPKVYYWDYDNIVFILSKEAIEKICESINSSKYSFFDAVKAAIADTKTFQSILDAYMNISGSKLADVIGFRITPDTELSALTDCMLSREEAIDAVVSFSKTNRSRYINIRAVQRVDQLGKFIVPYCIKVDRVEKVASIKILEDTIIDCSTSEILTNYSICSRIANLIALSDAEISKIFE